MRIDPGVRKAAFALVVICVACCALAYVSTRAPRRKGFDFRAGSERLELANFVAVTDPTWIDFDAAAWPAAPMSERPRMMRSLFVSGALDGTDRARVVEVLGPPFHEVSVGGAHFLSWELGDCRVPGYVAPCFLQATCDPGKPAKLSFWVRPPD